MEQTEIIEGNKLIAEFMGVIIKDRKGPYKYHVMDEEWAEEGLRYHFNWNWLMDVMEKIGKDYNVRITWTGGAMEVTYIDRPDIHDDNSIADFGGFGPIINTWKCAVKFIQWYNIKYFQFFDKRIIKRRNNQPYLIRWTIIGFGIDSSWFSIKLHNILASDEECLHNHPWAFISIILKGGYTEHTRALPWSYKLSKWSYPVINDKNGFHCQHKEFRRGSILFRPAHWSHRLELANRLIPAPDGEGFVTDPIPVWTLVFTFKKVQRWGFFTRKGWIPHWKYVESRDC